MNFVDFMKLRTETPRKIAKMMSIHTHEFIAMCTAKGIKWNRKLNKYELI